MKKVIIFVICILFYGAVAMAKVSGVCSDCHTMHYSQGGSLSGGGPYESLLINNCIGCLLYTSDAADE